MSRFEVRFVIALDPSAQDEGDKNASRVSKAHVFRDQAVSMVRHVIEAADIGELKRKVLDLKRALNLEKYDEGPFWLDDECELIRFDENDAESQTILYYFHFVKFEWQQERTLAHAQYIQARRLLGHQQRDVSAWEAADWPTENGAGFFYVPEDCVDSCAPIGPFPLHAALRAQMLDLTDSADLLTAAIKEEFPTYNSRDQHGKTLLDLLLDATPQDRAKLSTKLRRCILGAFPSTVAREEAGGKRVSLDARLLSDPMLSDALARTGVRLSGVRVPRRPVPPGHPVLPNSATDFDPMLFVGFGVLVAIVCCCVISIAFSTKLWTRDTLETRSNGTCTVVVSNACQLVNMTATACDAALAQRINKHCKHGPGDWVLLQTTHQRPTLYFPEPVSSHKDITEPKARTLNCA